MAGISLTVKAKKVMNFICLPNFHGEQQHFNITNIKLRYYFRGESFFFRQSQPKESFGTFYFAAVHKKNYGAKTYMLFAGWEVRIVKNCDRGLENAARGGRPRAAFSSPRSQFFTIQTDLKPANNLFIFFLR